MQVPAAATTSDTDTITFEIPKSQVVMLYKKGPNLVNKGSNSYSMNDLMLSVFTYVGHVVHKPTINGETNTTYLLNPSLEQSYSKEDIPSGIVFYPPMSSGEQKKVDDNDDPYECNDNAGMEEISKWKMDLQLIIIDVTAKTQDGILTNSGANISTSGPHGRWCSDYYVGLNEVLETTDLVNPNTVSLRSDYFEFPMNPN